MAESEDDRKARLARERLEQIQKAKKEGRLGPSSTPAPAPKPAAPKPTRERRLSTGRTIDEEVSHATTGDRELHNKIRKVDRDYSR